MSMTVVVTRDVPPRIRGFLASVLLEIAPGVYTSPNVNAAVRERIWGVLSEWHRERIDGPVVMTWQDANAPGGQAIRSLGQPVRELADVDGIVLSRIREPAVHDRVR